MNFRMIYWIDWGRMFDSNHESDWLIDYDEREKEMNYLIFPLWTFNEFIRGRRTSLCWFTFTETICTYFRNTEVVFLCDLRRWKIKRKTEKGRLGRILTGWWCSILDRVTVWSNDWLDWVELSFVSSNRKQTVVCNPIEKCISRDLSDPSPESVMNDPIPITLPMFELL